MTELQPEKLSDTAKIAIQTRSLNLWYGTFQALFDVDLDIKEGIITSLIGPSGCGKSTFLRSVNRINERLGYVHIEGAINVLGQNIYAPNVELVQVRKQVGMVFQRPWTISWRNHCARFYFGTRLKTTSSVKLPSFLWKNNRSSASHDCYL